MNHFHPQFLLGFILLVNGTLLQSSFAQSTALDIEFVQRDTVVDRLQLAVTDSASSVDQNTQGLRAIEINARESEPNTAADSLPIFQPSSVTPSESKITIDIDTGATWITKNKVRIPNPGGSSFDLTPTGALATFRAYLTWAINKHHSIRLLYAPLSAEAQITPKEDLAYNGILYLAGRPVDAYYQFNSYRLSYIYQFDPIGDLVFRLGFTAKIRDANIALTQDGKRNQYPNVGFVPLLHLGARYEFLENWFADAELEGLAGGPGRAFDGAIQVGRKLNSNLSFSAGYRFVEGGADVTVYNFAFIQSIFARISYSF